MQLSRGELLKAYHQMRTIREFEERVHEEFSAGNIPGFVHLYAGEEASGVGFCMHLTDVDRIASTHRGHGHCIAKGCDTRAMMHEIFGRATGLCRGKGGSMHIADFEKGMLGANAIVGGNPPIVIGAALSAKTLGTGKVAVSFIGDGASNQGTAFEAMNLAVVLKLPAIFVIENNGYGEAKNVRLISGQPQIIENERGLLIDFKIIATEVAGVGLTPALTANFGPIPPGQTKIGRWLMTSTLQGLFINYSATFEHLVRHGCRELYVIHSS